MKKTFVVLANSIRRSQRCIAGRELTDRDGQWTIGSWLRPVSQHGEGEVSPQESVCQDRMQPEVLDIVSLDLADNQGCAYQPENHFLQPGHRWERVDTFPHDLLTMLEERPSSLWLQPGVQTDRIHTSRVLSSIYPFQSLFLIRPSQLYFSIWWENDPFRGTPHRHRRAVFWYQWYKYNLPITDPTMDKRYFDPFPNIDQPPRKIIPKESARCLLVVSLATPFKEGYHYKVVATVLEY